MARGRHESVHTSSPRDRFNIPLDIDSPVDHPLFIKEEIDKNASGDPVAIRLFYKTTETDATPVDVFESDLLTDL